MKKHRKYHANIHDVLAEDGMYYRLSRIVTSPAAMNAAKNAKDQHTLPTRKTFDHLHKALYYLNKKKVQMTAKEYELWLLEPSINCKDVEKVSV